MKAIDRFCLPSKGWPTPEHCVSHVQKQYYGSPLMSTMPIVSIGQTESFQQDDFRAATDAFEREMLATMVAALTSRVAALEQLAETVHTEIVSLTTPEFRNVKPIPVLITGRLNAAVEEGTEYTAVFIEANMGSTSETIEGAVNDLKSRIASRYRFLSNQDESKLGRVPLRQLHVLRNVLEPVDNVASK